MVGQGELVSTPCQVNESWTLEDCTVVRCEGNNYIVLLEPQPVEKVACVNGHQPVKVQSPQDPCQYHYECECERRWAGGGRGRGLAGTCSTGKWGGSGPTGAHIPRS